MNNLLRIDYFSMTPYQYGKTAAKFKARPCEKITSPNSHRLGTNFLRHTMALTLKDSSACFILSAQFYKDSKKTPIEDPTIEWNSKDAPWVDLARIDIPSQRFTSEAQMDFCENLSFTPFSFSNDHRPLGGINRARKAVYEGISELRHQLNGASTPLPTGDESFLD